MTFLPPCKNNRCVPTTTARWRRAFAIMSGLGACAFSLICQPSVAQTTAGKQPWQTIQMPTEAEVARTWKSPPSEYGPEPYYGLNGAVTGNAAISVDSTTAFDHAEVVIGIATVLLIVILLGLVFRSLVISIFPIVVIGAVHQVAQAVTADLADWFHFVVGPELAPLLVVVMFGVPVAPLHSFNQRQRNAVALD